MYNIEVEKRNIEAIFLLFQHVALVGHGTEVRSRLIVPCNHPGTLSVNIPGQQNAHGKLR